MEKFKEKRIVEISNAISAILAMLFFISLVVGIFCHAFLIGFLLLPISIIPIVISGICSDKGKYTSEFIKYMKDKIKSAKSLDELNLILNEFEHLAIENKMYVLSFHSDLREIHTELNSKIEILKIIQKQD